MPQSLSNIAIHLIFSTKNRERILVYPDLRPQLDAYIVGILRNLECPSIMTRSVTDHVHILYLQHRTASTADVVAAVKKDSSAWVKKQKAEVKDPYLMKFAWQSGYGAFSVSESNIQAVKAYIEGQEERHRRTSFRDEYRAFLKKHNVPFDERYVWD
ncbi:MAG: IS200/IS605 family transposase [Kiritimatiellae bacterium]|nr:IS200/IS605 family transposase [Kiritimatiellia bacterium]